jgi:hypothetical protein
VKTTAPTTQTSEDLLFELVNEAGAHSHGDRRSVGWTKRKAQRITDGIISSRWGFDDDADKQYIGEWLLGVIEEHQKGSMGYDVTRAEAIRDAVMAARWNRSRVTAGCVDVAKRTNTYRIVLAGPEAPRTYPDTNIVFEFVADEVWLTIESLHNGDDMRANISAQGYGKEKNTFERVDYYRGGFGDKALSAAPEWLKDVCTAATTGAERDFLLDVFAA